MRSRVLGQFELENDLGSVRLPGGKVRLLLELLLLRPGERLVPEAIVAALWPDADPTASATSRNLHTTVSRLRRYLADGSDPDTDPHALAVVSVEGGDVLRASAMSLDRLAFDRLVDDALAGTTDPAGAGQLIEDALAHWHGEPYTGFAMTPAVLAERARLQESRQRLLDLREQLQGGRPIEEQLRSTKLHRPRVDAASILRRPRLLDRLPDVGGVGVIGLCAPVGYGKSVLLSQWAHEQDAPVAWLGLDPSERDPKRFWTSFTAAVELASPGRLDGVEDAVEYGSPRHLHAVAHELTAARSPLGIVLDDLHVLEGYEPFDQIVALTASLPDGITLAVGSRGSITPLVEAVEPRHRTHIIPSREFRFEAHEVEQLCASLPDQRDDVRSPSLLHERTGGWPVAVASLARAGAASPAGRDEARLGAELVERVLAGVPAQVRGFLVATAHLERLNRELCDAVTGRRDAGDMLAWLRGHELFVVESVTDSAWYRYHDLVREELRRHAELLDPRGAAERHRRAARWLLAHGLNEDALHHAVLARDRAVVAPAAGEVLLEAALRGETTACRGWMNRLEPDDLAEDARSHAIAMVVAALWLGTTERGRWLRSRYRHFGGHDDVVLTFVRAVEAADQGRADESVALTQRVLEDAQHAAGVFGADLIRAVAGVALSNLVLARLLQGTLPHDDPLLPNTVALLRPEAPLMAAWIYLYWSLAAVVDGQDELAASLIAEFATGTEGIVLAGARTPTAVVEGVLEATRTAEPARLRDLADDLLPAITTYTQVGAETRAAITRYAAAYLYRRAGDRDRAAEEQGRADIALRTFVDAPFVERFRDDLDRRWQEEPGVAAGAEQGMPFERLTDRELAILRELATNRSMTQIAGALHISVHTVRSHVRAIYRKLSVNSRLEAVLRGRDLGY